jgi:hypothetical protein
MTEFLLSFAISSAFITAPFIPFAGSVNTKFAPNAFNKILRSKDIDAGMVKVKSYPFAAAINAKPMPVFPDVGSTSKDFPGDIVPSLSAEFIIANPILSFTEQHGSMISNFAATSAFVPSVTLFKYTIGVHPTNCVTESAMFTRACAFVCSFLDKTIIIYSCFGYEIKAQVSFIEIKSKNVTSKV